MGLGDELMAAGEARRRREATGCGPVTILDRKDQPRWHDIWQYCPDVANGQDGPDRIKNCGRHRPYIDWPASTPQRWAFVPYKPHPAKLEIPAGVLAWADKYRDRAVVEPNIKANASPNKDWGFDNWERLIAYRRDQKWLQIGAASARRLHGVEFVECPSFIHAAAILSVARYAVLPEGGLHHAAAAVGCRAVVIFGGYVSPAQTGYDMHINLFTGGKPCGNRLPCCHCRQAMSEITVGTVDRAIERFCK